MGKDRELLSRENVMKKRVLFILIWSLAGLLVSVPIGEGAVSAQTPEPPSPTDASSAPTPTRVAASAAAE